MRVLILCLLIGSITCGPVGKGQGANHAATNYMQQPFYSGYWFGGMGGSSDPDSSSPQQSPPNPSSETAELPEPQDDTSSEEPGSDSSTDVSVDESDGGHDNSEDEPYNSPEVRPYWPGYVMSGDDGSAPGNNNGGGYGSSGSAYVGDSWPSGPVYGYYAAAADPEPVFSDVSDLDPVYSFSSRSSYQRGKVVFAQTRYIPGEPVFQPMPLARRIRIRNPTQSGPPEAPNKGGF